MTLRSRIVSFVPAALFCVILLCDTVSAQLPLRGRYVNRDGLFHVERLRWGGGISTNGVAAINAVVPVLNNAITTFGANKDIESDQQSTKAAAPKSFESSAEWKRLRQQQETAELLLSQTAHLVNWQRENVSAPRPAAEQPAAGDPHNVWPRRPDGSTSSGEVDALPEPGASPGNAWPARPGVTASPGAASGKVNAWAERP